MCRIMTYTNGAIFAAYRANAAWNTVHVIVLPTNWNIQTVSYDLNYVIADNKLYAYDRSIFSYVEKTNLAAYNPLGTGSFSIRNTGGRILVWIRNEVSNVNMTAANFGTPSYLIGSAIYYFVFHDSTSFVQIGVAGPFSHIEYSSTASSNFGIFHSPQMSKFGFGVSNGNWTNVYARHVDYGQDRWYPV